MGLRSAIGFVMLVQAATLCQPAHAAEGRPVGRHCDLVQPPATAGEDGAHGYVLLVYPRTTDLAPGYNGCQAIFAKSGNRQARLAWLVEIRDGDAIRLWSDDREMADVTACRYARGELVRGDPDNCPRGESLLRPTQPAGCFTTSSRRTDCNYDKN